MKLLAVLFLLSGLGFGQPVCNPKHLYDLLAPECAPLLGDLLGEPSAKPGVKITSAGCLRVFPPDEVGGFCEWYGYATKLEAEAFEWKRGYVRVKHADGSSDTWRRRWTKK